MKTQRIFSQSVVATLTAFVCVGGALFVPMSANADAKSSSKSKPSSKTTGGSTNGSNSTGGKTGGSTAGGSKQGSASAGAGDIKLLEAALSITLTDDQKTAITAAATTRDTAVKAAMDAYRTQVAAIFGLTASELDAKIKSAGNGQKGDFATLLATVLGRALTDAEKTALSDAAVTCDAAVRAAYDAYGTTVAALLGMTAADLQTKVQTYLDSQGKQGGASGGQGSGGKDCPPPPSGTGSTGTGSTGAGSTGSGNTSSAKSA